jgi:hypothetical protein
MKEIEIGKKYNRLTILSAENKSGRLAYRCKCDCGNIVTVFSSHVTTGHTKSCGCLVKDSNYSRIKNIAGQKFGRLTAIRCITKNRNSFWLCKCDCGNEKWVKSFYLTSGKTKSCGCYHSEVFTRLKHGDCEKGDIKRLYKIWVGMRNRCESKNLEYYKNYAGRGIKVCAEWHDYLVFREWALTNGYADNLSIDRINNDGNYEPSNCRWATSKEQGNNTRRNVIINYGNFTKTLTQWSEYFGIKRNDVGKYKKSKQCTWNEALEYFIGRKQYAT